MLEEILNEIIKEAKTGQVEIDNDTWPIAFNTVILEDNYEKIVWNDQNNITLMIKNKERLLELLENYIEIEFQKQRKTITFFSDKEKNHIKWLIAYLFVNATTEDFLSPVKLVTRNIRFLKDTTFDFLETPLEVKMSENLLNSTLVVQKNTNSTSMETPFRIDMYLKNVIDGKEVRYNLPSIYYGIRNTTCFIYSIMMPKQKSEMSEEEKTFNKKINRILYKINDGTKELESQEYFDYKSGLSDYYPEDNISDVTHSFLLAINTFISLLQMKKINNIKVVTYLPLRYQSRELAANRVEEIQTKNENEENYNKANELRERNEHIQENITNKVIRTIRRLALQNPNIKIVQLPYEIDEFLGANIDGRKPVENEILQNTDLRVKIKSIPASYD